MAKPVSMRATIAAIRDAVTVTRAALGDDNDPAIVAAIVPVVVREFLDNEYDSDLDGPEARWPRPARS